MELVLVLVGPPLLAFALAQALPERSICLEFGFIAAMFLRVAIWSSDPGWLDFRAELTAYVLGQLSLWVVAVLVGSALRKRISRSREPSGRRVEPR